MVSRHDLCVYASGYVDEEDLCVGVWGAVVGGEARGRLTAPGMWRMFRYCGGICGIREGLFRI